IRLSEWHTNYEPNTKVMPEDLDNLDVVETVYDSSPIKYVDVNDNQMYDLYDGVVYDLDDDDLVSVGDILQTDIPAVDVYSLEEFNAGEKIMDQGELGNAWDRVDNSHPAYLMDLFDTIGTGDADDLMKWVDADDSNDWSCEDKLYLIQPHENGGSLGFDHTVTIGDTRVYIPEGDACIPVCGTKVVQGDHDATYMLMTNLDNAKLAHYTFDIKEWYVDMDGDNKVSFGDVRLTNVSNHYGPNTKVKLCDEFDLGHDLTWADWADPNAESDQTAVRYAETDDLPGYTLGDRVYVDVNDYSPDGLHNYVEAGDIRLVEAEVYMPGNPVPFVYPAWSVVDSNDVDVGDNLLGLLDRNGINEQDGEDYTDLSNLLGYIDTDCTGTWTCPDKLYIQQYTECDSFQLNLGVSVGDLRLYVPVNDPTSPFFGMEDWPECGTKVTCADIDVEYGVSFVFHNYDWIKFVDRNNDGIFTEGVDHVYVDMDESDDVTVGDVRLTDVSIKNDSYENNTKVDDHDLDRAGTMMDADLYVTVSDEDLLAVVPYVAGIGVADPTVELPTESFNFTVSMFDNDCSGDWTCVDALYLSIDDQFWQDNFAVTHKDIRLFIPPGLICDGEVPNGECDYHAYDANQDGMISIGEVSNAIDDYRAGQIDIGMVSEVIDLYRIGGSYCV
ncbi:hypothetical protein, partial [Methanococcoides seepicolus]